PATGSAATPQPALARRDAASGHLQALYERRNRGAVEAAPPARLTLPGALPRAGHASDGHALASHGPPIHGPCTPTPIGADCPLMYQGMSHRFLGPHDVVAFATEADDIDFEGEFGVIVGEVPMGTPAERALDYVRLAVQINDWSLRRIAPLEMKTGFGWI